jgi:sulfur-carrier protein
MSHTVTLIIPTPLRKFTDGEARVSATGATVGDVLNGLDADFPGLRDRVCEADGSIRRFVNVFLNGVNVKSLDGAASAVKDGDEIGIVPAMAGGADR